MTTLPLVVTRNGQPIPAEEARVHIQNPAVLHALGVYETVQVLRGHPFCLDEHVRRLERSAEAIQLRLPASHRTLKRWVWDVVSTRPREDSTVRILAVNGDPFTEPTVYVLLFPPVRHPRELYERGACVVTYEGERALPTAKTLNTLVNFLARRAAEAAGCHEGLLVARDGIREGASSNVFVVIQGGLVTPPDHLVIAGVTRDIVIRLARERGYRLIFRPIPLSSMPDWDEMFITSTSRHVMPVTRVNGHPVGTGEVGPITQELSRAFEAFVAKSRGTNDAP
ncbi:MAG: hypothetical protein GXO55_05495 [Chloroflexi bacterium]|nr:hypothetical protein [Chloroflexota bacterium]